MATIQERLNRMKQDGLAADVQRRLNQMKEDGQAAQEQKTPAVTPGQGSGSSLQAGGSPHQSTEGVDFRGQLTPRPFVQTLSPTSSLSSIPKPKTAQEVRAEMEQVLSASANRRSSQDIQTEMDQVGGVIKELSAQRDALNGQVKMFSDASNTWMSMGVGSQGMEFARQAQAVLEQVKVLDGQISQLEKNRAGLQSQWNRADQTEFDLKMLQDQEYRAAVDKALGADYGWDTVDSRKPVHRDVGYAMTYFQAKARGDERLAASAMEHADMALDRMSESQRNRLAWYVGTGDYDGAADYLNRIVPELNQAEAKDVEQTLSSWAQEHPFQGAAVNITSWPFNIPAYFSNAGQAVKNAVTGKEEQNPHLSANVGTRIGTGTSQGTQQAVREAATQSFGSETAGEVASFLVGTGLSIGQNVSQIAILGPGSLAAMGFSAAGSATQDVLDRGGTAQQAFLVGTSAGAIEAITEKIPLDNLFRLAKEGGGKGLKVAVIELLKQMGTEAGEEMISEIANNLVDAAVMGESSEYQMYVRELQAAGLSKEEAERAAFQQFYITNVLASGLGGAISGGVMGGGAMAFNKAGQYVSQLDGDTQKTTDAIDRAYQTMVEKGMFSPEAGQAVDAAREARGQDSPLVPTGETLRDARNGLYLPTAEQGTVTLPGGEDAVQGAQRAAEGQKNAAPVEEAADSWVVPFSEQEAANLTSAKGIVAGHGISFRQFIDGVKQLGNTVRYYFGKTSSALGEQIKAATGHDVTGYNITIRSDEVMHAMERHGNRVTEESRGQVPLTADIMEQLPRVFESPDEVVARSTKDYAGRDAFEIRKQLDGYMVAVVGVANGKHSIEVDTVYVINRNGPPDTVDATQNASPNRTSETSSRPAQFLNQSISQLGAEVNAQQPMEPIRGQGGTISGTETGQELPGGDGGRISGASAGGQAGILAEGGSRRTADTGRAAIERSNLGQHLQIEKVSAQDLGIDSGADARNIRVLPESAWDGALRDAARKVRRETGKSVQFVLGGIQVTGSDGAVHQVRGTYSQDGIIVQADNLRVSPEQIADHEIFHDYAQQDPGLLQAIEDTIVERYGQEGLDRIVDIYIKKLRGLVDAPEGEFITDLVQAMTDIKNEVFADAYAGINAYGADAGKYQGEVLDVLEKRGVTDTAPGREYAEAVDGRTGPPSVQERFSSEAAIKGSGVMLPTGEQGTVMAPRADDLDQTRFSVDDDSDVPNLDTSEEERIPDGLGLPTLKDKIESDGGPSGPIDPPKPPKKKTTKPIAESRPIIAKQELRQTMLSLFSIPEGMRSELGAEIDRLADRALKNGGLSQSDRDAFFDRMYESGVMELEVEEFQEAGRNALKGGKIYVPAGVKSEFGGSAEWNEFRKRAFAAGIILTNNRSDSGIDTLNEELAQSLPGLFDPNDLDSRSILERFVQVAEEGRAEKVSLSEYTAMLAGQEYVSEDEVLDNLERQMDWALRTFTEKANLELKLRDRTGVKLAQQRDAYSQRDEARRMREVQRQAAEREQRREAAQQKREAKELREMQNRTLKQLQWLKRNMDRAPSELREAFGEVLGDLDIYAVGAAKATRWNKKHGATWQDLAQMYKDAQENDTNFKPSDELERIVKRIDGAKVGDLDVDALQDLYKAAVGLRTEFEKRKQLAHDKLNRQVDEVYRDSKLELEKAAGGRKPKVGGLNRLMNEEQLSPINMMERMAGWNPDSTFFSMAKQLEQGERDIRGYTVEAERHLADFLDEYEGWVKKSDGQGKDAIWYEIEVPEFLEYGQGHKPVFGDTVKVYMTPAQKVHMYLESKSVDNLRHMEGGRTFVDRELYAKGERQEAFAQGTTVRLAPETVKRIVSDLTLEEQAMAEALEGYYNGFARERINKVSNELYGYDKAMSKNYAPIYTNSNYNQTQLGMFDVTAEGVGRLKTRVRSSTPSYNLSAMDAFERHVEQTARFVGMSIPARNWDMLLNWQEGLGGKTRSMQDVITHTWGDSGLKLVKDTIENLQGGGTVLRADSVSTGMDKLFSNYISAVFGANPSIVFKQMGSIPMAAAWLDFKNFPNPAQIAHIDRGLIAKYTQELDWRTLGYSTPETKQLKDNPNWSQSNKAFSFLFGGDAITAMDGWAASVLWPWAENKVRRENPELKPGTQEQIDSGTDPFYQKVAEAFNDAVARSQSTSDEMHQGSLRKSKNSAARAFTMFKSDSSQLYNALRQMAGEASYYKRIKDEENAKKARRRLGAVLLAAIGGYIWAEGIEFLMNLWKKQGKKYRDDEGELTTVSVVGQMGQGLVSDLAGVVAGGEELADILGNIVTGDTWYGISTPGLEQLTDVIELGMKKGQGGLGVLKGAADVVKNGGDLEAYLRRHSGDIIGGIKETAAAAATYLPGLPVNNLEAYMLGTVRWVSPELAAAYEDTLATANKNRLSGLSSDALTQRVGTLFDVRDVELGEDGAAAVSALYEAGWKGAVPSDTPSKISVDGEDRTLGAYQQQVYDRVWSGTIGNAIDELVGSETFQAADDETREQMLKSLYSYAGEKAKGVLFDDYAPDVEKADAFLTAGASAAQWAAWQGQLGALGRAAKVEERSVKDAEKLGLIQGQDWTDEVKIAAVGTVLGTDMETKSGNPTQYAKLLEAVDAGGSVDTWLAAKALTPEKGEDGVSEARRWRAIVEAAGSPADQKAGLLSVMSDSARMKYEIADSYGIEAEAWVQLKEALPQFDANENGSYSAAEIENAIDALCGDGSLVAPWDKEPLRLSREDKAVLWQLYTGSTSGKNNPYSSRVGNEAGKALEKAKEEAKKGKK